jgi:hypothetical protein
MEREEKRRDTIKKHDRTKEVINYQKIKKIYFKMLAEFI